MQVMDAKRFSMSNTSGVAITAGLAAAAGFTSPAQAQLNRVELGFGGFLNEYFFITDIDEEDGSASDFNEVATHFDGEIQFTGSTQLENGLEFGAQIELEFPTNGDQIDEAYLFINGGFGRLVLGGENTVMYQMGVGKWEPGVGVPINSGWVSDFSPAPAGQTIGFRSPSVSTAIDITNDDNTISYYSPKFGGVQVGVSYVPNASFSGNATNGAVDTAGLTYSNGLAGGVTYSGKFDGFGFRVSGGYATAQAGDAIEDLGGDDIQQFMAGAVIDIGKFQISGSYANELDGRINNTGTVSTEGQSFIVGAEYKLTDKLTVGGAYFQGAVEGDPTAGGDDEQQTINVGLQYVIGPGVSFGSSLLYNEYEEENGGDSSAVAVAAGLSLSF